MNTTAKVKQRHRFFDKVSLTCFFAVCERITLPKFLFIDLLVVVVFYGHSK